MEDKSPYFILDFSKLSIASFNFLYNFLSEFERDRSKSYLSEKEKKLFISTRGMLRFIVTKICDVPPTIKIDNFGKPYIANLPISFSVSHTVERAIIVLGRANCLGADIELIKDFPELREIRRDIFHPIETKFLESDDSYPATVFAFYRAWVRKEAVLKAIGTGFLSAANLCRLQSESSEGFVLIHDELGEISSEISILERQDLDGYAVSIVALQKGVHFTQIDFSLNTDLEFNKNYFMGA